MSRPPRIAVIGAGPCGLAAGRELLAAGLTEPTIFEQGTRVGGNWVFDERPGHSSVYETARIISSKRLSAYEGHPMPADYPDYPSHRQMLAYFEDYAERFAILPHIRFRTRVLAAEPLPGQGWRVLSEGPAGPAADTFDHLLVASGHHSEPRHPDLGGRFAGTYLHAHDYKRAEPFRGQRVLVIGGGNSACDIAVELSAIATQTCLSLRRGYYIVPRHLMGLPSDRIYHGLAFLPPWARQQALRLSLRLFRGGNRRFGLPEPDHAPFEHHPTVNSEILGLLRRGRIEVRPPVAAIAGRTIRFADGREEPFDAILAATGYRAGTPFLPRAVADFADAVEVPLYHRIFHPAQPSLYFIGFLQPIGCIWTLAELQARLVAAAIRGSWRRPPDIAARIRHQLATPYYRWARTPRHALEVDHAAYRRALLRELRQARRNPAGGAA